MVISSTRRAALSAILAAPLASVPASAAPVSPELIRLISEHDAHRAVMDDHPDNEWPGRAACKEAGYLRACIVRFPSKGWADTMAKAACLARLYPLSEAEEELARELQSDHAYLDSMALGIACEVMRYEEAQRCT